MCQSMLRVPAGHGKTFTVSKGQFITVTDAEGQQAADFVAVNAANLGEKLSPVHTRQHLRSLFFKPGDALWSSENRPMLRIVADTIGIHDANVPACDRTRFSIDFGVDGHRNCVDNLLEGMQAHGVTYFNLPEPFNLFQNGPVTADGRMEVTDPNSKAGDCIVFEALCDLICAVSSCPQDIIPGNGLQVTPIDIQVSNHYHGEVRHVVNA
ncbi:urea carboxylase-associated family protein [Serratia ficaria]|uniref:urea carboxylase-associated family protein n=1 Tax=Serratia ficaria TaxID=61651 RepID=UPI0021782F0D|nr:urea carboxylase-associated family protein [Serratia ficaria]CAI0824128.1 urea carboxylase-associated protein 1 [Serratia ficaria]CAI1506473.1 urea carboxylase-associated protein 1 [Serratia ficaria]CAI1688650.1 urea carboxylase-associated protein 1 [Serratia ficaria]